MEVHTNKKAFGNLLKTLRLKAGLSQVQLSTAIGVKNQPQIAAIEKGDRPIPAKRLRAYADALNMTVADLARLQLEHHEPVLHDAIFNSD